MTRAKPEHIRLPRALEPIAVDWIALLLVMLCALGCVPRALVTILGIAAALAPFSHTLVVHLDSVVAIRRARENKSIEIAKAKVLTIKTAKTGGQGHGHGHL